MRPRIGPAPTRPARSVLEALRDRVPFGLLHPTKPRHFREMIRVLIENADALPYALRILRHGVCDGCSLGPRGLEDDVIDGIHLCTTRLRLLRFNTMGPLDPGLLSDVSSLARLGNDRLHALGRLPVPMIREPGEPGFRRIGWTEALDRITTFVRKADPERCAWYCTSRGISNEGYYAFQKAARLLGCANIDNAARLCHAPSVIGLQELLGVGAPTCELKDLIGTDLLVLWGTNLANNQPVATKYLHIAKKRGTRIAVVNPFREPGLERYWVPSIATSALFGTPLMDDHYPVAVGGDIAFANGVLKALREADGFDRAFVSGHADGYDEACRKLDGMSWESLERGAGLARAEMERFAAIYKQARTAVFVWSMGLTQRTYGVQNVRAITTLALARGMVGREKTGLMPIRGHSGVQGGAECGAVPNKFPSGFEVNAENARRFSELWGRSVPSRPGLAAPHMIEAAHEGRIDLLYAMGGNFLETLPDPEFVRGALARLPFRVHQDIVVNSSALLPGGGPVVLLPAMTRYEMPGGCTQTSTERRIRFSPEIPGPRIAEARPEWEPAVRIAARIVGESHFPYKDTSDIRREMDRVMPLYKGIGALSKEGDQIQWGGPRLCEGWRFDGMPSGRARLSVEDLPEPEAPPEGRLRLTTRRGKQFNSMVFDRRDPLAGGAGRDSVFVNPDDAAVRGWRDGDRVEVRSEHGRMAARIVIGPVRAGAVQAFWPEANALLPRRYDPRSKEPADDVWVELRRPRNG